MCTATHSILPPTHSHHPMTMRGRSRPLTDTPPKPSKRPCSGIIISSPCLSQVNTEIISTLERRLFFMLQQQDEYQPSVAYMRKVQGNEIKGFMRYDVLSWILQVSNLWTMILSQLCSFLGKVSDVSFAAESKTGVPWWNICSDSEPFWPVFVHDSSEAYTSSTHRGHMFHGGSQDAWSVEHTPFIYRVDYRFKQVIHRISTRGTLDLFPHFFFFHLPSNFLDPNVYPFLNDFLCRKWRPRCCRSYNGALTP